MDLAATEPMRRTAPEPRFGTVDVDGTELTIASRHLMARGMGASGTPRGYVLTRTDGTVAGAIETNGSGNRRLIVPRAPGAGSDGHPGPVPGPG